MMRLWLVKVSFSSFCNADWKSAAFSKISANLQSSSVIMVFSTAVGLAIDWLEPTMRNSNLLPVKAMGEVRLRSVVS